MLEVFYAETAGADEARARYPGRSKRPGSAFAVSLLAYAVREVLGVPLPKLETDERGKPYFPQKPDLHFSYAHTEGLALCALSDAETGADAERLRTVSGRVISRFTGDGSLTKLPFFEAWTLMESAVKLDGAGSLLRFSPVVGLRYRHYALPGCTACVCSRCYTPPAELTRVDIGAICT